MEEEASEEGVAAVKQKRERREAVIEAATATQCQRQCARRHSVEPSGCERDLAKK